MHHPPRRRPGTDRSRSVPVPVPDISKQAEGCGNGQGFGNGNGNGNDRGLSPPWAAVGGRPRLADRQAQTDGELSNFLSEVQSTVSTQVQMPPQSAPPWFGSQLSLGSSTHLPPP